jgi:integrase
MAKKNVKQDDGFIHRSDASGNTAWSAGPGVYAQSRRIPGLLKGLLASNTAAPVELFLVLLDGVHPSSLSDIVDQASSLYSLKGALYLEWTCSKTGVPQRRAASPLTVKHWPGIAMDTAGPCLSPFLPLEGGHKQRLGEALRSLGPYASKVSPLATFEEDVLAWWSIKLPPVLFAHLANLQTLNAVPRSALARKALCRPLPMSTLATDQCGDIGASSEFLDAAMASETTDVHSGVIQLAVDIFRVTISTVDGLAKRYWLAELNKLVNQSMHAGPWACLVIGWGCYMVEVGTLTESNPAVSTLQSYFSKGAHPIYNMLQSMPYDFGDVAWSSDALSDIFQSIIDQQSVGNQATIRAALHSLHAFMAESYDIEPLRHMLKVEKSSRPAANVVWEHEVALACSWARNHPDLYIGAPAQLVLSIAAEAPCRADELTRLRVGNISFVDDGPESYAEIEIARDAAAGRLKTHSSQRRVFIKSPRTLRLLRAWLRLRHQQGAGPRDFLFGAPADLGTIYKPNAVLAWCAALLRAATGDPSIRLHNLRHSAISRLVSEVLCSTTLLDINRLEVIAAEAGHASPVTTLFTYTHLYEQALRLWLDITLQASAPLNSSSAPHLLDFSASATRQAASRAELSASDWMWHKLRDFRSHSNDVEPLYLVSHTEAEPPVATAKGMRYLSLGVARSVLKELLRNTPLRTIGWRYAIDIERLKACLDSLQDYCLAMARRMHPRTAFDHTSFDSLANVLRQADIDFEKSDQPKFDALWKNLEKSPDVELLRAAVDSWALCRKGTHIGLSELQNSTGLLRLLKEGNVGPPAIQVCLQSAATASRETVAPTIFKVKVALLSNGISALFAAIFHRPVSTVHVVAHPDRPMAYLRWNSPGTTEASGGSTRGLDALMVCIYFYLFLVVQQ